MDAKFYETNLRDSKILDFAEVEVADGITVKGFRVVRSGESLFIGLPSREFKVDGVSHYANQIVFRDSTRRDQFTAELLQAYERWASGQADEAGAVARPAVSS